MCFPVILFTTAFAVHDSSSLLMLPLRPVEISSSEALLIAKAMQAELIYHGINVRFVDRGDFDNSLPGCDEIPCADSLAETHEATKVLFGAVGKLGNLVTVAATVWNAQADSALWSGEIHTRGSVDEFYAQAPKRIAEKIAADLIKKQKRRIRKPEHIEETIVVETLTSRESTGTRKSPERKRTRAKRDNGIVTAPAFGISGRFAVAHSLGDPNDHQSPWNGELYYVHPVTSQSHLRAICGVAAQASDATHRASSWDNENFFAAVEHEWGKPYFGLGVGLTYSYMGQFTKTDGAGSVAEFDVAHVAGISLSIRGGKTYKSFRGKISYPLPFYFSSNEPLNTLVSASALGVFGSPRVKGAVGVEYTSLRRTADRVRTGGGSVVYEHENDNSYVSREDREQWLSSALTRTHDFYAMLPVGKVAFLVKKRHVIVAGLELGGLVFPPLSSLWKPSVSLQYTFSTAILKTANALDGRL